MWAAQMGEATMCEQLIAAGADINAKDDLGSNALRYAVLRGRYETAEVLIKSGANVNMPNIMGDTVLMRAAQSGNIDLVRLLLSSGAERTFQAKNGTTALDYVPYPRNPTLVQLLGSVFFVPIGDAPISEINALVGHYREKFGMEVEVLPRMKPGSGDLDASRQQLIAENVTESVRQAHPEYARNTSVILLGVTGQDMYPRGENWQFCFGWRNPELGTAVVSTARMNLHYPGEPRTEAVLSKRLRKVITKDIGIMLFGKRQSENPRSVLYNGIMGIQELDQVSEYF